MAAVAQRHSRVHIDAGSARNGITIFSPGTLTPDDDDDSSTLIDWSFVVPAPYANPTISRIAQAVGSAYATVAYLGELATEECSRTARVNTGIITGQSIAHAREVALLLTQFGDAVKAAAQLGTAQLQTGPHPRVLSDDDIDLFDRALFASSKVQYTIDP